MPPQYGGTKPFLRFKPEKDFLGLVWYNFGVEKEIYLEPIKVVYTNSFGHPSHSDAFARLEKIVPLKGNKFYATYDAKTQEYCACAEVETEDQIKRYKLPEKIIAGGWYVFTELKGPFNEVVKKIAPTFDDLAKKFTSDITRLPVEFYKRHTHIILYLPILKK